MLLWHAATRFFLLLPRVVISGASQDAAAPKRRQGATLRHAAGAVEERDRDWSYASSPPMISLTLHRHLPPCHCRFFSTLA